MTVQGKCSSSEPVSLYEMLKDPIFERVAGAGPYRSSVCEVMALCDEVKPKILAREQSAA